MTKMYEDRQATVEGRARSLLCSAARRSEEKDTDFDLDEDWIADRIQEGCALTKREFDLTVTDKNPYSPSLDRINPKGGYLKSNTRVICLALNIAAHNWGIELVADLIREAQMSGGLQ